MRSIFTAFIVLGATGVLAAPALTQDIITKAGGAPPNGPPYTILTNASASSFQLANYLENLEAAFFAAGLANITQQSSWDLSALDTLMKRTISHIAAQEQVHVATIEGVLNAGSHPTIPPCNYTFPVTNAGEFLALGSIITSVGIGAVNYLAQSLAGSDPTLVTNTISILSVESRHDAFFRLTDSQVPNPSPFDTQISPAWAYNLAQPFIVKGSCPKNLDFPILTPLTVTNGTPVVEFAPQGRPQDLIFAWDSDKVKFPNETAPKYIAWVNQANLPLFEELRDVGTENGTASVPANLTGLAFAALTARNDLANINDLTTATLAGPVPVPFYS